MRSIRKLILYTCVLGMFPAIVSGQKPVEKTNPMKVYMHYMPWFETPETIGGWGWHWTMNTRDPNVIEDGQRQIASHYYPLIGPYASRDKDVIEYHLLLMKLSGIDGVLIDWYGTAGSNGDIKNLLKSSDSIVAYADDFGLQFGVVLEDRFSRSRDDVKANLAYLRNNYFNRDEYIRTGADDHPLLCIFGPITFEDEADWNDILPAAGEEVEFVTLWYESGDAGTNADGEYSWIYQDELDHLGHLTNFYTNRAPLLDVAMGSAYPGFNDYYAEGGAGTGYFNIPHYYGSTLSETLNRAALYNQQIDILQLATFNDFGEGTMFEPTVETGFDYLNRVQEYTGVTYGKDELALVYTLYLHRKGYANDDAVQDSLDRASEYLRNLEIDSAAHILDAYEVIVNDNNPRISAQKQLSLFPNPFTGGSLHINMPGNVQGALTVKITDQKGSKVFEKPVFATDAVMQILLPAFSAGMYMVTVYSRDAVYTSRLLVQK